MRDEDILPTSYKASPACVGEGQGSVSFGDGDTDDTPVPRTLAFCLPFGRGMLKPLGK